MKNRPEGRFFNLFEPPQICTLEWKKFIKFIHPLARFEKSSYLCSVK